jgi:hypothetical protein
MEAGFRHLGELRQVANPGVERIPLLVLLDPSENPLDVTLRAFVVGEQLLDRSPLGDGFAQLLFQSVLAGADLRDRGLELAAVAQPQMLAQVLFGLGEPLLHLAQARIRDGAAELACRPVDVLLRFLDPQPALQDLQRVALPRELLVRPEGGRQRRHRRDDHYDPGQLLDDRLRAQRCEQGIGARRKKDIGDGERQHDAASDNEETHLRYSSLTMRKLRMA